MKKLKVQIGVVLAAVGMSLAAAQGAVLESAPFALPGFNGTVDVAGSFSTRFIDGKIHYAVFAPGDFSQFLSAEGIGWSFPEIDDGYVYAYQGEVVDAFPNSSELSVGLVPGASVVPATANYVPEAQIAGAQVDPAFGDVFASSVRWTFLDGLSNGSLTPGSISTIVFFNSPDAPGWEDGTLTASVAAGTDTVPSPLPEPAAAVLTIAGLALMSIRRRSRE